MTDEAFWDLERRLWCPVRIEQRYVLLGVGGYEFIMDLFELEVAARCDGGDPGDEDDSK